MGIREQCSPSRRLGQEEGPDEQDDHRDQLYPQWEPPLKLAVWRKVAPIGDEPRKAVAEADQDTV